MTCTDYQRHELTCPHHAGTRVDWKTADGCSGSMCPECTMVYQLKSWPDLVERVAGPPEGLEALELLRILGGGSST